MSANRATAESAARLANELRCSFRFALGVLLRLLLEAGDRSRIPFAELDDLEARLGHRGPPGELLRVLHVARLVRADADALVVTLPEPELELAA